MLSGLDNAENILFRLVKRRYRITKLNLIERISIVTVCAAMFGPDEICPAILYLLYSIIYNLHVLV